jgi:signal transduction histidine kinase
LCSAASGDGDSVEGSADRELVALDSVGRLTAECADLHRVLGVSLDRTIEFTGLEMASVALYEEGAGELQTVAHTPPDLDLVVEARKRKDVSDLIQKVVDTADAVVVEDIVGPPGLSPDEIARLPVRSFAGLPLKSRGQLLGVSCVGGSSPHSFPTHELAFLSVLAGQMSWAVESTVLRERLDSSRFRLRERVKELSILYDISREALVARSAGDFLDFVARRLPASMQYQKAVAVVYCVAGGCHYLSSSGNLDEALADELRIVPGERTLGRLLVDRGLLLEYEISKLEEVWQDCDVKSILAVPIVANGETVGSISVYYLRESWQFLEEEQHLLRGISEQVSLYLEREAIERENRHHAQQVSTLFDVSKALASVVELGELLPTIQDTLVETLPPAEAGALLLFDNTTGMLTVASSFGYELSAMGGITLRVGESMSGKVLESGQPEVWPGRDQCAAAMESMTQSNRELYRQASGGLDYPRSAIGVPLVYRDEKIGVLTLETLRAETLLTSGHLPFLQALAELIVINIGQIRLLQKTEQARAVDEADRLRSELIAALAHEMRTPLTSIQGHASALLLEDVEWDEASRSRQLEIIEAETRDLQNMIQDLLESSIIDAGLLVLAEEPTLIPRMVEGLVEEMTRRTTKHRFVISFPADFPIVQADPRRIEQVLRNLLDNAVKYSPEGGLVVVRGQLADNEAIVSVADNGAGIAPEHLNRLFEKFFRIKSQDGHKTRGTGLGLPVSRTIVESHGGRIWAESELGKGTTIYFSLPYQNSQYQTEED